MKKSFKSMTLLLFAIVFAVLAVSCKANEPSDIPEGMKMATNDAVGYYFYYPEMWTLDKNDGMISAYVSESDPSSLSVTTYAAPRDFQNLEVYFKETYPSLFEGNFTNMEFVGEYKETTINEYPALSCIFTADIAGTKYEFMQEMCVKGGYIYIVTFTSTPELYSNHIEEVERAVSYITFK